MNISFTVSTSAIALKSESPFLCNFDFNAEKNNAFLLTHRKFTRGNDNDVVNRFYVGKGEENRK